MKQIFIVAWLWICFITHILAQDTSYEPREGDMIFQSFPHSELTDTIEEGTGSPFSHCGVVHQATNGWVVIEAVGPVKETPLSAWIERGREGHFAVFRLKAVYAASIPAFMQAAESYEGLPYDIHFDMSNKHAMYCSGLLYEAFLQATGEQLGKLQKLGELNWKPHVAFIKEIENGNVPLERVMITPRSVSEAPELEKVYSNFKTDEVPVLAP